ncbi:alpha/beta hydrolase [Glaciecola siphonariae]|uniref:Alpha/beta hydrolase n=1 Tax=Glaciecola siphonariae TaxID=521012 RepID=A0ABV9LVJ8_9ALTE
MSISRVEVSNPQFAPNKLMLLTISSTNLHTQSGNVQQKSAEPPRVRRQDVCIYNAYSEQKNLPVVLLLHGVYGNHWAWMFSGGAHLVLDKLREQGLSEFVLVMPSDGGIWDGSAYLPLRKGGNFERWIVDDVISAVTQHVDSVSESSNVYIAGLSMGGYGALRLGSKYPDLFSGISAHSAVTELADLSQFTQTDLRAYATADDNEPSVLYWMKQHKNSLPPIRFDCGKDDVLFEANKALTSQMNKLGIAHRFEAFEGGHEWDYWHQHLDKSLKFFDEIERNKAAAPKQSGKK